MFVGIECLVVGEVMAEELGGSVKLNKQVNTIPWPSFSGARADVDRGWTLFVSGDEARRLPSQTHSFQMKVFTTPFMLGVTHPGGMTTSHPYTPHPPPLSGSCLTHIRACHVVGVRWPCGRVFRRAASEVRRGHWLIERPVTTPTATAPDKLLHYHE